MKKFIFNFVAILAVALWSGSSWGDTLPPGKKPVAPVARAAVRTAQTVAPRRVAAPAAAASNAQAAALSAAAMNRSPASVAGASPGGSRDISEELKIMGQSRNLSMGLLFQKDKDKLTFGTPRTNYQDKISDKKANF